MKNDLIDQKKDKLIAKLKNDLIVYAKGYKVESWFTEEEVKLLFSALQQEEKEDFSDIDFREQIANELSRDELIERLCEMNKVYTGMRKEWFDKVHMNQPEEVKCQRLQDQTDGMCPDCLKDHYEGRNV